MNYKHHVHIGSKKSCNNVQHGLIFSLYINAQLNVQFWLRFSMEWTKNSINEALGNSVHSLMHSLKMEKVSQDMGTTYLPQQTSLTTMRQQTAIGINDGHPLLFNHMLLPSKKQCCKTSPLFASLLVPQVLSMSLSQCGPLCLG